MSEGQIGPKVLIERVWGMGGTIRILFVDHRGAGHRRHVAKPVELEWVEQEPGTIAEPTLVLDGFWAEEFLRAFAEALDEKGIRTDKDARIEGNLEATRYHLEDLRTLLKLRKRPNERPEEGKR